MQVLAHSTLAGAFFSHTHSTQLLLYIMRLFLFIVSSICILFSQIMILNIMFSETFIYEPDTTKFVWLTIVMMTSATGVVGINTSLKL